MLNKILIIIGTLISGAMFFFSKGKKSEQNRQNEKILDSVTETKKRRNGRSNDTVDDDLNWLLKHKDD